MASFIPTPTPFLLPFFQTSMFIKISWLLSHFSRVHVLYDPIDSSPPGSPIPEILQARTLDWVVISFSKYMKVKSESEVAQSCLTLSETTHLKGLPHLSIRELLPSTG